MEPRSRFAGELFAIFTIRSFFKPGILLWLFTVIWGAMPAPAGEMRALSGHVPPAARAQPLGLMPQTNSLRLAISLPWRNNEALNALLQQIYDPNSPDYHHYLTPEQFAERFGPSEADYAAVIHFATTNGLTVAGTHSNRMLVDVEGAVSDIERAFQVTMRVYRHPTENREFYAPDTDPSVDSTIPLLDISGFDNYVIPHPMNLQLTPAVKRTQATPANGSGPGGTYMGNDFRSAYVPGVALTGSGQNIGLFELDGYYAADIASYESQAGLPNVTLMNVLIDGANGPDNNANWVAEVSLDIEMAISMAPGVSNVIVYEGPSQGTTLANVDDVLNQMATDDSAKQLSSSWSWGGGTNATTDQIFLEFAAQGQSFFEASGDSGAYRGTIPEPSDDPYITIVGGTTLTTTGPGGSWVSETTWSWFPSQADASSGGISTLFAIPSWQKGVSMSANQGSKIRRNIPDVAMTADNIWVLYNNGQSGDFGGTSCAAPLWAGFTSLINQRAAASKQPTAGFVNPAVYQIGLGTSYYSDFHDITTGNNTNGSSRNKFFATTGYDLCTGWGSPNGINLIGSLTPGSSPIAPTLTWDNPAAIVYGIALNSNQLNATAIVPGTFAYTPPAGAVLDAGTNLLSAVFNPGDAFDYDSVTASVSLVVSPALLTVTATNTTRPFGQPNPMFPGAIAGLQNGDNITATYSCSATSTSPVGTYPIVPSLNDPADIETNYMVDLMNGTLTVEQAAVVITWDSPARITYGTAINATQLDATANVPGVFVYNPATGTVLNEGTNTLAVVFTPNDSIDYLSATDTVSLVVTAPQIQDQGTEDEPLFPTWGVAGLILGLAALGAGLLARRTPSLGPKPEGHD